ncbi:hypothetical protein [Microbacterium sp. P5_E9]
MTDANAKRRYQRILRWYPKEWRAQHEQVMLGTLLDMDDARGRRGPTFGEAWSLRLDGLRRRLRPADDGLPRRRRRMAPAIVGLVIVGCVSVGGLAAAASPPALSDEERAQLLAACLNDKGWATEIGADGGVAVEYQSDQEAQHLADAESCITTLQLNRIAKPSRAQLEAHYANLLAAQRCLEERGYATPKAPDRSTFVVSGGTWSPFAALPNGTAEDLAQIERACPQPDLQP